MRYTVAFNILQAVTIYNNKNRVPVLKIMLSNISNTSNNSDYRVQVV